MAGPNAMILWASLSDRSSYARSKTPMGSSGGFKGDKKVYSTPQRAVVVSGCYLEIVSACPTFAPVRISPEFLKSSVTKITAIRSNPICLMNRDSISNSLLTTLADNLTTKTNQPISCHLRNI